MQREVGLMENLSALTTNISQDDNFTNTSLEASAYVGHHGPNDSDGPHCQQTHQRPGISSFCFTHSAVHLCPMHMLVY